ncbi:hypothetical protein [Nocardia sp. NPDC051750]|uniref:hypothetical protein n=1 Tax=Nocardia sp. NPDC051750 TaxID=3364325 RepID=UPI003794CC68
MKESVCISGPHGGGKSYLIDALVNDSNLFRKTTFEIDFLSQFTSFSSLRDWERSLIRLYHRIFMASLTVDREPGRCVLISRGPLDSEAYIEAYYRLGWIEDPEYKVLRSIVDVIPAQPPTILLLPDLALNRRRLDGRRSQGVRAMRDTVFSREDAPEFLIALHAAFQDMSDRSNVLTISDNQDAELDAALEWIMEPNDREAS